MTRPQKNEAADYYFGYINLVPDANIVEVLQEQMEEMSAFLSTISEEQSVSRYAAGKWSLRELLNHINDTERVFVFRALWFARGFTEPLPSFDQEIGVRGAGANDVPWSALVEEFRSVRKATLDLFRYLPDEAWNRSGVASENLVTVNALAYIIAGHVAHHANVIRQRYLPVAAI